MIFFFTGIVEMVEYLFQCLFSDFDILLLVRQLLVLALFYLLPGGAVFITLFFHLFS